MVKYIETETAISLPTPPMETPDPPSDTPGASKQVVLTPHDIPRSLRVVFFLFIIQLIANLLYMDVLGIK